MTGTGRIVPGFWLIFRREFGWLRRRRFLLCLTTLVPLALIGILMVTFSARLVTHLPVAVLDLDGSEFSRQVIRAVNATPDSAVSLRVADLSEGKRAILQGKVYGLLMLPKFFERDMFAGRRPDVVFFYNNQFMTAGGLAFRGVNNAVPAIEGAVRVSLRTSRGVEAAAAGQAVTPIPVQVHALFNPTLDYSHFLLAAVIPAVLQVMIVVATAYTAGLDLETTHRLVVLRRLGGGIFPALAGKILPYTLLFLLVLGLSDLVLFGYFDLPLRGSRYILLGAGFLFVLACQLMGLAFALVVRPMVSAISIATLITSPAFGFMGVGFPRISMNMFAYGWGGLMPGTWYLEARIDQTLRGTPVDLSMKPVLILLAFVFILTLLAMAKLWTLRRNREANSGALFAEGRPI